jgi:peptide/nickel transport system substrate-binding protein
VDIVYDIMPQDIRRVESHPELQMIRAMNLSTNYIGFNVQKPPFNDVRVRQAIAHALDLEAMVRNVYMGAGAPGTGPINPRVWASAAARLRPFEFNPARARQLLAEAGYPNGFNTTFIANDGNTARIDTGEILQNMLRQVGINVDVRIIEWGAYLDMTARGEHDIYILGWVTVTGDPDYGLHATFHSENFGAAGNRSFYSNPEVDRLLDAGRRETNPQRREQLYIQAQEIIHRDVPWIFQWFGEDLNGARNNVRGFRLHPAGHHALWPVYFE